MIKEREEKRTLTSITEQTMKERKERNVKQAEEKVKGNGCKKSSKRRNTGGGRERKVRGGEGGVVERS